MSTEENSNSEGKNGDETVQDATKQTGGSSAAEASLSEESDTESNNAAARGDELESPGADQPEQNSQASRDRKKEFALVGKEQFLLVLLFNVLLAIAVGSYLTWFWEKNNLKIEYSTEDLFSSSLDPGCVEPLLKKTELTDRLRSVLSATTRGWSEGQCLEWLDLGKLPHLTETWEDACAPLVIKATDSLLADLKKQHDSMATKTDAIPQDSAPAASQQLPQSEDSVGNGRPANLAAGDKQRSLAVEGELKILESLRSEMKRIEKGNYKNLTGRVDFLVGVLNAGNSDDVIKDFATLEWKTEEPAGELSKLEEQWKQVKLYACRFTLLKGHSFQQIRFMVDEHQEQNVIDELKHYINQEKPKPIVYRIILRAEKGSLSFPGILLKSTATPLRAIQARPSRDCEYSAP